MKTFKEQLAASIAIEDTGIYPKSMNGVERSEWQDGWNACAMDTSKNASMIEEFLDGLSDRIIELIQEEQISVWCHEGKPSLYINCNDLFFWGCADAEDFEVEDLADFDHALRQSPNMGSQLFVARRRGMRPQKPFYKCFTDEEKVLFDACGPERDE